MGSLTGAHLSIERTNESLLLHEQSRPGSKANLSSCRNISDPLGAQADEHDRQRPCVTALPISISDEFFDVLAARVADALLERLESPTEWLRVDRAADHLQTTSDAIRALVKRGKVPVHRRDGRLYFDKRELDNYVRGNDE
jgi:hypothetical protein